MTLRAAGWQVDMTCGAAPVQLEGVLPCGELFYFRARHDEVLLAVGGEDPADIAPWEREVEQEDASYLPADPGLRLLAELAGEHEKAAPESIQPDQPENAGSARATKIAPTGVPSFEV
ncbi:hypothetical protein [Kutzneria chonburiensis]|uniref:hypothetical protein n=1 Tax=Kutzneria chonburiensis TaxID=1483604 RepID=UPI00235FF20E|nr:hypothetical protein [Kutzneria chonburiensis]